MRSFIIAENRDSYLGLKLAGIDGVYAKDEEGIAQAFKDATRDKDVGIIYMTEKAYQMIEESVMAFKHKNLFPLITVIPDRHGYQRQQGVITQYIKESVGL